MVLYWVWPPPSNSDHQTYYIFSRESLLTLLGATPSTCTVVTSWLKLWRTRMCLLAAERCHCVVWCRQMVEPCMTVPSSSWWWVDSWIQDSDSNLHDCQLQWRFWCTSPGTYEGDDVPRPFSAGLLSRQTLGSGDSGRTGSTCGSGNCSSKGQTCLPTFDHHFLPAWKNRKKSALEKFTHKARWWFQTFFYFHPDPWQNDPIWRSYFLKWVGSTTS